MSLFIIGAPRSGTSLLYKSLCLHPDAAWLSNWVRRFPAVPSVSALNRIAGVAPGARSAAWFDGSNAYVYGARRRLAARAFPAPVEGEPVFARCGFDERATNGGEVDEHALRRYVATVCRYSGGSIFVSKRIANNQRVRQLARALPDSKFVFIVRDGRAVALSLSQVDWWPDHYIWWCGVTPADWAAQGRDPWLLCARVWVEEIRAALDGLQTVPRDRVLQIRYEDLLETPTDVLQDVARFAGLPPSKRWDQAIPKLAFAHSNERWRTALPDGVAANITELQHTYLEQFGYPLDRSDVAS